MEWCFPCPDGAVTVRQEGQWAVCRAMACPPVQGLFKAWLTGERGRALLGTLIPEGGVLRLRRRVTVASLEEKGVWPPEGAEILLALTLTGEEPPIPGWQREEHPARLVRDSLLERCLRGAQGALTRQEGDKTLLALPYASRCPFPLAPLFCLGRVEELGGRRYAVFRFSADGVPVPMEEVPAEEDGSST